MVPRSTLHDWVSKIGRPRTAQQRTRGNRRKRRLPDLAKEVAAILDQNPLQTIRSVQSSLATKGYRASTTTIHRAILECGRTFQKVSWRTPPRDMTHELRAFFLEVDALVDTGVDVISIDETGFLSNQYPLRGYGVRGRRLRISQRHPKRFKVTGITAISCHGLVAMDLLPGNADGRTFQNFVRRAFAAAPNSVAIMDNIGFHKSETVRQLAELNGVRILFTPPYSPECNPVEHFFSAAKTAFRRQLAGRTLQSGEEFTNLVDSTMRDVCSTHNFEGYFGPRIREIVMPITIGI